MRVLSVDEPGDEASHRVLQAPIELTNKSLRVFLKSFYFFIKMGF